MAQDVWFGGYNHNTSDSEMRFLIFCHNVLTSTKNLQLTTPDGQRDFLKNHHSCTSTRVWEMPAHAGFVHLAMGLRIVKEMIWGQDATEEQPHPHRLLATPSSRIVPCGVSNLLMNCQVLANSVRSSENLKGFTFSDTPCHNRRWCGNVHMLTS